MRLHPGEAAGATSAAPAGAFFLQARFHAPVVPRTQALYGETSPRKGPVQVCTSSKQGQA